MRAVLLMCSWVALLAAGGCGEGRDGSLTYIDAAVDAEPDAEPDAALPDGGEADADG